MVSKLFLSDQNYSNRPEYDFLQVWFNIIDHTMSIKGIKVNIFFPVHFVVGFYSGSEWGWTYIPLMVPQYTANENCLFLTFLGAILLVLS